MQQRQILQAALDALSACLPNAIQGKPYSAGPIRLPKSGGFAFAFCGLDAANLAVSVSECEGFSEFTIEGTPVAPGDYSIFLRCACADGEEESSVVEKQMRLMVLPNPRLLWRDLPTPSDILFFKPDKDYCSIKPDGGKRMVGASMRGRSHAQEGKPRDDHFAITHSPENGWYVMAVADGAGSAKYSRRGSEIACEEAVGYCNARLADAGAFERAIRQYHDASDEEAARKAVGNEIYSIIGNAAFRAHRAIIEAANAIEGSKPKDFATTLMLAICKRFDFGWFIASFWVGDGAMCIYDKGLHSISLLGVPDEGEFSGQTRFLTMPEIFADTASLYRRLRFGIRPDFTALMLMTDGVSDPMFGTDANLNNPEKWDRFWDLLHSGYPDDGIEGVDFASPQAHEQLLAWLGFWAAGEHDDRTIAILY